MIQCLDNSLPGATIALVGSSPSCINYVGKEDYAIALNGGVLVNAPFSHHLMFDRSCPRKDYYYYNPNVIRVIGSIIAPMDKELFENPEARTGGDLRDEWLESHTVISPHVWWYYKCMTHAPALTRETNYLCHQYTCAHPGLELAWRMGASRINMYGIELGILHYRKMAAYTNELITRIKSAGCQVYRTPSKDSCLDAAEWLV
jgi:hypothetical protein